MLTRKKAFDACMVYFERACLAFDAGNHREHSVMRLAHLAMSAVYKGKIAEGNDNGASPDRLNPGRPTQPS